MGLPVSTLSYALGLSFAQLQNPADQGPPPGSCAACGVCGAGMGTLALVPIAIFVLNIALLVWVARDAKARGLDNAVLWMALVMFTSVIGLIIYIFARPQGQLVKCQNCNNNRLQSSATCPSCGHP